MTNLPQPGQPGATLPPAVTLGLQSLLPGIVRTLVPVVVALIVRIGFSNTGIDDLWLERALTVVVTMGYYVVVRLLERYWRHIGWLLGYAAQPVYVAQPVAVIERHGPPPTVTVIEAEDGDPAG